MDFCGVDVSAKELVVALRRAQRDLPLQSFPNTATGHRSLISWLLRQCSRVRITMEATGNYSLDLAFALSDNPKIELAVANPRMIRRFAESLGQRSKTDPIDARVLLEHAVRMPFVAWQRPSAATLALRDITRQMTATTAMCVVVRNQLHAAQSSRTTPACVIRELRRTLQNLQTSLARLLRDAKRGLATDHDLQHQFELLLSIPGVAERSALQLLAELAWLGKYNVRQWVKHAGLDVREGCSGKSVRQRPRISKCGNRHLRRALYMPALVACRFNPALRGFYLHLLERGKTKLQAIVAVMRKLLHAIFGMLRHQQPYDGSKIYSQAQTALESVVAAA